MIYLDTCVVIYSVEWHDPYATEIANASQQAKTLLCISPLVQLECLVKPLREKSIPALDSYKDKFKALKLLSIEGVTYLEAAKLRAAYKLKTPDALHLACAKHHGCTEFWTNDERLNVAAHALGLKTIVFK